MDTLLKVTGLNKHFGGLHAIKNVDFELEEGEMRAVIGPNGSGKSTFFNLLSGIYPVDTGTVVFDGYDITDWEPHRIAESGVARTFQLLRMFTEMSVLDNLRIGHHCHVRYSTFAGLFGTGHVAAEEKRIMDEMMDILELIGLADFAHIPASEMSIGQRRLLALGRSIAMRPKLLLLDEPAAGLAPVNVDNIMRIMMTLKERYSLTVVIVEHILKVVMTTCDRISVLDHGEKIAEGTPEEVSNDHAVIEAYLGREMSDGQVKELLAV